jgi:ATP phosphoribosyltransferase regulatory subunit
MSSAWLLPEHLADVLPHEARRIEELRRMFLDSARCSGFELVMPPMLEHLGALLTGTGSELDLKTFKLVDQLSGRTLGLRADITPQVARIDAHLLNRVGVTRLCYCGPVLHTTPSGPRATREPMQFGAEIYGHAGLEADLEVLELALDSLSRAGVKGLVLDLADARLLQGLLEGCALDAVQTEAVRVAVEAKDAATLKSLDLPLPEAVRQALVALCGLYGGDEVLERAREQLPQTRLIDAALADLSTLAGHLRQSVPQLRIGFDLADLSGYAYYSGARFAIYAEGCTEALVRGGRYDDVGAAFGRSRPAVGFSADLKTVVECVRLDGRRAAIRAPWGEEAGLRAAVRRLRELGEVVVCVLPGHEHEADEFECDRELVDVNGQWVVSAR